MRRASSVSFWGLLSVLASVGVACGDDGTSGAGAGPSCPEGLAAVPNSEFCAATAVQTNCDLVVGEANQVCGIPLVDPPGELSRVSDVEEFAGTGPANVACFVPATYPAKPGSPQMVTVNGHARIFSSGCDSHDLRITFYRVVRDGGPNDGQLGEIVGTAVTTPGTCVMAAGAEQSDVDGCVDPRWECSYSYANVPTETELAIKTEGDPTWAPLIQYNIYIPNSEVSGGAWSHDVRALATPDYSVIPQTAIGGPIQPGNGAVAGEVHDCEDKRVLNAVANIDKTKRALTYFTSNEDSPLPDLGAKGTSKLGLYAALDVPAGQVTVAAMGTLGGQPVTLGYHRVWVYPDTVSSVTFRGLRPYQVP